MNYFSILPLTIVLVAGPQIISASVLAAGPDAWHRSVAYLGGATGAVLFAVTVVYWLIRYIKGTAGGGGSRSRSAVETTIDVALVVLVVILMVVVFLARRRSRPPRWMSRRERARPGYARLLGLLLFLLTPANGIVFVVVAASLVRYDRPWWHLLPFVGLTLLLTALPLLARLLRGERAGPPLRTGRAWVATNAWLVNEFAAIYFLGVVVANLIG